MEGDETSLSKGVLKKRPPSRDSLDLTTFGWYFMDNFPFIFSNRPALPYTGPLQKRSLCLKG
jgi:hypothetical protein